MTSLAFLLLIYVPKFIASAEEKKNAIAEEKRKAYSSFIENRVKRDNDFDDDQPREEASCSSDDSSHASNHDGGIDATSAENATSSAKCKGDGSARQLTEKQGSRATGLKIVHNPRSERNLSITQGREMSRKQLEILAKDGEFGAENMESGTDEHNGNPAEEQSPAEPEKDEDAQ